MSKKVAVCGRDRDQAGSYLDALKCVGAETALIIPGLSSIFESADGLVLTGGPDINPALYGQRPVEECGQPQHDRDSLELRLVKKVLARDMPILAVCRGMQMLNVALGGTLIQHLSTTDRHRVKSEDKGAIAHTVVLNSQSRLAGIFDGACVGVNSRHHQALDRLGNGVVVVGHCPDDGVVEAIEIPSRRWVVGVQWHPENMDATDAAQHRLFAAFVAAL